MTPAAGDAFATASHHEALELAQHLRVVWDDLVERVRSGEFTIDHAHELGASDVHIGRVFAVKVYEAIPGVGKVKSRRALAAAGVAEGAFLVDVTTSQRQQIATSLSSA